LWWILATADQQGFVARPNEVIRTSKSRLNMSFPLDIDISAIQTRIFVLNAPMGCDKTHIVSQYILANANITVLAITFRIALATYTAERFGIACYKDKDNDRLKCICAVYSNNYIHVGENPKYVCGGIYINGVN
jgi:hypothetical protein